MLLSALLLQPQRLRPILRGRRGNDLSGAHLHELCRRQRLTQLAISRNEEMHRQRVVRRLEKNPVVPHDPVHTGCGLQAVSVKLVFAHWTAMPVVHVVFDALPSHEMEERDAIPAEVVITRQSRRFPQQRQATPSFTSHSINQMGHSSSLPKLFKASA